ncbi:hypothetical protein ACP70R_001998 [Stipagrostis hirtigluma subsp. patula]
MEEDDDDFQNFLYDTPGGADVGETNDLDKYMAEPPLRVPRPGENHYNTLKSMFSLINLMSYYGGKLIKTILSLLACDVLAVQASTVASESAFSAGGRVIDPFRNRLDPEMVEALICTKDWVAASRKGSNRGVASILNDLEVAETLIANLTLEDLEDKEKQLSSDDEDED